MTKTKRPAKASRLVRFPVGLLQKVDAEAERKGVSGNTLIVDAVAKAIEPPTAPVGSRLDKKSIGRAPKTVRLTDTEEEAI